MDQEALFEHRFWLQILGDHARFIYGALPPDEQKDIEAAKRYIEIFDSLLEHARLNLEAAPLAELNQAAKKSADSLREYKLNVLERLLLGQVKIGLTPMFLNHMVNELEEYVRILDKLLQGKPVPRYHPLHHDLLWLPDAAGHATAIAMGLDAVEKRLIQKCHAFEQHFNAFYLKALELIGYLRTLNKQYPSIGKFHQDVDIEMLVFMAFLKEIEELDLSEQLLSRLSPLVPDHMYREECYYLRKLAQSGWITAPDCDPAKPRVVS